MLKRIIRKIRISLNKILNKNNTKKYIETQYKIFVNDKLNLDNPKTFNEKINWIKLNYYNPLYEKCCDKIEVCNYIKEKNLEEILLKKYAIYNSINEINIDSLPNKFVIKTSHSSGGVVVVNDKTNLDIKKMKKVLKKSFDKNLYDENREWQYKNVKPRILVEEKIDTDANLLEDYKFYCIDGKVEFIHISTGILGTNKDYGFDFYDKNWNYLSATKKGHKKVGPIPKPKKFEEMKKIAEILASDFVFVRVDLYCENDKIYFGELTFTPGNGMNIFEPKEFDLILGEKINLEHFKRGVVDEKNRN